MPRQFGLPAATWGHIGTGEPSASFCAVRKERAAKRVNHALIDINRKKIQTGLGSARIFAIFDEQTYANRDS
jgi:hypothetical protein